MENKLLYSFKTNSLLGNTICADCNSRDPNWCSISINAIFAVIVCDQCAGAHRNLSSNITKVQSLILDNISDQIINQLISFGGNKKVNEILFKYPPGHLLTKSSPPKFRLQFIKKKYVLFIYKSTNNECRDKKLDKSLPPLRFIDYFTVISHEKYKFSSNIYGVENQLNYIKSINLESKITDRYPLSDWCDSSFPNTVSMFCFPSKMQLKVSFSNDFSEIVPSFHTFVLTNEEDWLELFCLFSNNCFDDKSLQYFGKGSKISVWSPKALCLLSEWPFVSIHERILRNIVNLGFTFFSDITTENFLTYLIHSVPIPSRGTIGVQFQLFNETIFFTRPAPNEFPLFDFDPSELFRRFEPEIIISAIACLVTEQKVLLLSSNLHNLVPMAETLKCLMYPFDWAGIYMPLIPSLLSDFFHSPVPFFAGVFNLDIEHDFPDGIVVLNADTGTIKMIGNYQLPIFPEKNSNKLLLQLKQHAHLFMKDISLLSANFLRVRESFSNIFASIFADVHNFISVSEFKSLHENIKPHLIHDMESYDECDSDGANSLDEEEAEFCAKIENAHNIFDSIGFIQNSPCSDFVKLIIQTQHFSVFISNFSEYLAFYEKFPLSIDSAKLASEDFRKMNCNKFELSGLPISSNVFINKNVLNQISTKIETLPITKSLSTSRLKNLWPLHRICSLILHFEDIMHLKHNRSAKAAFNKLSADFILDPRYQLKGSFFVPGYNMKEKVPSIEFIYDNCLCYPHFNIPKLYDLECNVSYAPVLVSFDERYKFKYIKRVENRINPDTLSKFPKTKFKIKMSPTWIQFESWLIQVQAHIRGFLARFKIFSLYDSVRSLKAIIFSIDILHLEDYKITFNRSIEAVKLTQANIKATKLKNEFNFLMHSIKSIQFHISFSLHLNQKRTEFQSVSFAINTIQALLRTNILKKRYEQLMLIRLKSCLTIQKLYRGLKFRRSYYKSCEIELMSLFENVSIEWNLKNTSWLYRANFIMAWFPFLKMNYMDYLFKKSSEFKPLIIKYYITPWALYISAFKTELNRLKNIKSDSSTQSVYVSSFTGGYSLKELSSREWFYMMLKAMPDEKRNYLHKLFKIDSNDLLRKQKLLDSMFSKGMEIPSIELVYQCCNQNYTNTPFNKRQFIINKDVSFVASCLILRK